jgi:hypothetical protein
MMGAVVGLRLPEKHCESARRDAIYSIFEWAPLNRGGGKVPYIEGVEKGF